MEVVFERLYKTFSGPVLNDIVKSAQKDKSGRIYYDDFLGDGDVDFKGSPLVSHVEMEMGILRVYHW